MKTKSVTGCVGSVIFTILFLFYSEGACSQQVIKLKNGKTYYANVKSQSADTLVFQLLSKPTGSQWVLMNEVDYIKNFAINRTAALADTLPDLRKEELFDRGRTLRNTGFGLDIGGAVVTGLGLALLIPAASEMNILSPTPDWAHDQLVSGAIVTAIGAAGLVTGVILTLAGSAKMKKYSIKHSGISLDFNCIPGQQGVSLVYRF